MYKRGKVLAFCDPKLPYIELQSRFRSIEQSRNVGGSKQLAIAAVTFHFCICANNTLLYVKEFIFHLVYAVLAKKYILKCSY